MEIEKIVLRSILVMVAVVASYMAVSAVDCVNVPTYDGATTLIHGASACAELQPEQTEADKGKQYVTCNNGILILQNCSVSLRYDTVSRVCNYPSVASCTLPL